MFEVDGENISAPRLVRRAVSALVVLLANVALVAYLVGDRGASSPIHIAAPSYGSSSAVGPSPGRRSLPPSRLPVTTTSSEPDPKPTALPARSPRSTSTTAPVTPAPIVTIPPHTTAPSTSLPSPPSPAPSLVPNLKPSVAESDPPTNIVPSPSFSTACGPAGYNASFGCVLGVLAAIDNARADEALPPMVLPTNWSTLDPEQQLLVATNLERTARGLAPLIAVATALGPAAAQGVAASVDPKVPPGFPYAQVLSNWAGNVDNPLEAMYYWMYDDGLDSPNIDCTPSDLSGCWGHRHNLLAPLACNQCVMGGAFGITVAGTTGVSELIVETTGPVLVSFTWEEEEPFLP